MYENVDIYRYLFNKWEEKSLEITFLATNIYLFIISNISTEDETLRMYETNDLYWNTLKRLTIYQQL